MFRAAIEYYGGNAAALLGIACSELHEILFQFNF